MGMRTIPVTRRRPGAGSYALLRTADVNSDSVGLPSLAIRNWDSYSLRIGEFNRSEEHRGGASGERAVKPMLDKGRFHDGS